MSGQRTENNWALWDWLQTGNFIESNGCTEPGYQEWMFNAVKASLINSIWKAGGTYIVRIPVDDCANGDKYGAANYFCDTDNKWLNSIKT